MGAEESRVFDKIFKRYLFLPALFLSVFAHWTMPVAFGMNLIEIAKTFNVSVGTISQIPAIGNFLGIAVGLLMVFLSVRFNNKSLWLVGMAMSSIACLSIALAPNLAIFILFKSLLSAGDIMVGIMVYALIGEFVPLLKRGAAVGLIASTVYLTAIVTSPVTSLVTNSAGWQSVVLWYIFPISTVTLLIGFIVLPSNTQPKPTTIQVSFMKAFRQILLNKSAVACIAGMTFLWVATSIGTDSNFRYR